MAVREGKPVEPKKPNKLDIWICIAIMFTAIVAGAIFNILGDFEVNNRICAGVFILTQAYYIYYLIRLKPKRDSVYRQAVRKYRDELNRWGYR